MTDLRVRWVGLRAGLCWPWVAVKKGYDRWNAYYTLYVFAVAVQWRRKL